MNAWISLKTRVLSKENIFSIVVIYFVHIIV